MHHGALFQALQRMDAELKFKAVALKYMQTQNYEEKKNPTKHSPNHMNADIYKIFTI